MTIPATERVRSGRPWLPLLFLVVSVGPSPAESSAQESAGTAVDGTAPSISGTMEEALRSLARRTPDENPWLGDRDVREMRIAYAGFSDRTPIVQRIALLDTLGNAELRIGNAEMAIEHLDQALALIGSTRNPDSDDWSRKVRDDLQIAWLRRAENENCVEHACCTSCLYPFDADAVHQQPESARKALELQLALLAEVPGDARLRWLAHLTAAALGEPDLVPERWRLPSVDLESAADFPRLENAAPELGLDRFSLSGGVIIEDFDGDNDLDLVESSFDPRVGLRFLRNVDGSFQDQSEASGLSSLLGGLNMVPADFDNDGDLDFLVLRGAWLDEAGRHPNSLVRNEGEGRFVDVTIEAGLFEPMYPTQTAAWGDYDQDGDLDLYIGNEDNHYGWANQLFRNDGNGKFQDVAEDAGVTDLRFTKGVVFGDYDEDGFPDLFVSNLGNRNRLYHNQGDGTFEDVASRSKMARPVHSFPTWFFDANNDGHLDLFVASYDTSFSSLVDRVLGKGVDPGAAARLFLGDGAGGFSDRALEAGIAALHPAMGANFGDLDSDGYPDFYLGTGFPSYDALMPNQLFHNVPSGSGECRFVDATARSGTGHLQKGHGVAFSDLDGDYDVDLFAQMGGAFPGDGFSDAWFRNPGFGNHMLKLRLVGVVTNRSAIGARVRAVVEEDGVERSFYSWVSSGGSFGASPLLRELGVGSARVVRRLEIAWPTSQTTQVFENVPVDRMLRITEGAEDYEVLEVHADGSSPVGD